MSQRNSEYERQQNDAYQTPAWVVDVLAPHLRHFNALRIWEPAAGKGQMVDALRDNGFKVLGTDYVDTQGCDFLNFVTKWKFDTIATNPPFKQSREFIERALELTKKREGVVAMLGRVDYDSAITRRHLFDQHPAFALKIVLLKRIVWFKQPGAAPSFNHAWYIWSWKHKGPPRTAYGP